MLNRRDFIQRGLLSAAAIACSGAIAGARAQADSSGFTLPNLPYPVDALMPHIDAQTMEIHHGKHHAAYVNNLNKALAGQPELLKLDPIELIRNLDQVPAATKQAVINNGGGHVNHMMFWQMMAPNSGGTPGSELAKAIDSTFGSFEKFQADFSDAAMKRFGSGWAWLVSDAEGRLVITSTANQDSPFMTGQSPLLGIDVWEHAYYLKYQNRRADFVKAWWNVVNWDYVAELHAKARKS